MQKLFTLAIILFASAAQAYPLPLVANGAVYSKNWYTSSGWIDGWWMGCEWRAGAITVDGDGVKMTVSPLTGGKAPYKCGELQSMQIQKYGTYTASIKTAAGSGLNTALFTYSANPHDEIDFEFLGKKPTTVQVNYWVNGKSMDGAVINLGFDASASYHTYSFRWEPSRITWYADGKQIHQTKAGAVMPSHQGRLYLSLWAGSKSENGWLGALNYTSPVSAWFQSVNITPCNPSNPSLPPCQ